ncbi:O-antigen ligase family protein [Cyanobium sp. ATX 6E8]|uniref:O-antigen ligase family protein n=1 Tax=Cyanobium sp. ATX 6E8 TaxID=2823701 RepID=UPI0020CD8342|nr:O-antigen ligase family protein [Cyanobium sp. ATX 6E8]MCP9943158.1 O-antigen ligase family protein [Cyanobium sp. ATX 6E8]
MSNHTKNDVILMTLSSAASILLFAWQPFPGEYRIGIFALMVLGIYRLLQKQPDLNRPALTRLLQLLACSAIPAIASLGLSINKSSTLEGIGAIFVSAFVGLGMITGLENTKARLMQQRGITIIVAAWILSACLYSAISIGLHGSIETLSPYLSFLTSSRFGRLLTMLMPMALWRPIRERSVGGFGLLLGAGIATILSGQRNNILSYLIGACLLLGQLPRKLAIRLFAAVAAIILCVYPFSPELKTRTQHIISAVNIAAPVVQDEARQAEKTETTLLDRFNLISSDRGFIYDAAIKMGRSNPLTGTGAFTFKDAYPKFADRKDKQRFSAPPGPHNIYLGILAQTGIIGLAGLFFTVHLLVRWHTSCKSSEFNCEEANPYSASLIVMLFPLITQNDFYSSFFSATFLYMGCGLLTAYYLPSRESDLQESA